VVRCVFGCGNVLCIALKEQILGFDIAVNDVLRAQELESIGYRLVD